MNPDRIVERVRSKLLERSQVGIQKYGCTMEREDFDFLKWISLFQEELLDGAVYAERMMEEISRREGMGTQHIIENL